MDHTHRCIRCCYWVVVDVTVLSVLCTVTSEACCGEGGRSTCPRASWVSSAGITRIAKPKGQPKTDRQTDSQRSYIVTDRQRSLHRSSHLGLIGICEYSTDRQPANKQTPRQADRQIDRQTSQHRLSHLGLLYIQSEPGNHRSATGVYGTADCTFRISLQNPGLQMYADMQPPVVHVTSYTCVCMCTA